MFEKSLTCILSHSLTPSHTSIPQKYCSVGVAHLELMLSARSPLNPEGDYICNDDNLRELLQKGKKKKKLRECGVVKY